MGHRQEIGQGGGYSVGSGGEVVPQLVGGEDSHKREGEGEAQMKVSYCGKETSGGLKGAGEEGGDKGGDIEQDVEPQLGGLPPHLRWLGRLIAGCLLS